MAAGEWIGPYRVAGRLGAGGMGEVLLGVGRDGRLAAVKTVRRDLLDHPEAADRFRREIEALRAVESPYVARLLDADPEAEVPWLASEFVAGPRLDRAVAECGPLPVRVVADLGLRLAAALADVHGRGLLHRDLKPGNVLVADGGPKLIDFGLARAADEETLTTDGLVLGSLGYMAPEQVADARQALPASDVFSLGAVLVFAATGTGPYGDAPAPAMLHRMARAETELGAVPEELRGILGACLLRDPAERPTLAELVPALEALGPAGWWWSPQIGRMIERSAAEARAAAGRTKPRRPRLIALGAALAVLVAGGTVAALRWGDDGGRPTAVAVAPGLTGVTEKGGPGGNRAFPAGRSLLPASFEPWSAYLADQPTGCSLGRGTLVCRLVDGSLQALDTANGHQRWRVDLARDPSVQAQPDTENGLRLIPRDGEGPAIEGDRVASSSREGALRVQELTSGRVLSTTPFGKDVTLYEEPLAVGDRLFLTVCDHSGAEIGCAFSLKAATFAGGEPAWSRALGHNGPSTARLRLVYGAEAADEHAVYASTPDGIAAFDPGSGAPLATLPEKCGPFALTGSKALCRTAEGLVTAGAGDFAGRKDLAGAVSSLHDQNWQVTAGDGTVIVGRNGTTGVTSVLDAGTGALRRELTVDGPGASGSAAHQGTAPPVLLGTRVLTMTDTRLTIAPVTPDGAPAAVELPKPGGAPGLHVNMGRFPDYARPRVLALDGLLIAIGGDGAVHALAAPQ
ncbi:protein kinase domain-containing protein [Streptomyces sp. NRRL WC-3742]|uniref:serine/threonine-protein kinase n=1 Tax=Streptomyces sp. NRRL WC-3742 TaxID=1463934 RepID=UPI00068D14F5|nr:serine/threonine-protein kinase [Streptomyces sp. NRRL WC-3742]